MSLEKYQILHRLTGFIVIVFILFYAVTGIILNHSSQLGLDKRYIDYDWLLDWYGINPSHPVVSYQAGSDWLSMIDSRLYLNDIELPVRSERLLGSVKLDGIFIVALYDELLLLTENGETIERVSVVNGLPAGMRKIGYPADGLFIIEAAGGYYANHAEIGDWQPAAGDNIEWSTAADLPDAYYERIMSSYRGQGLSVERVINDLHSGRLLGSWKLIIVDMASLLLIFSAISGVWMWYKKKKMMAGI